MSNVDSLDSKFRILISSIRDYAIFMLDRDGRVASWNLGAQLIKGYQPDEIIGRPIDTFYSPQDRESQHPQALLEIARRDGRVEAEGWRVRKDGTRFWADVVITALFDDAGELLGYAKVTRDLTERRAAEAARIQAEEKKVELVQANEAIRLRDEFLSIASHELRTPLMALQLLLDSISNAVGDSPKVAPKLVRASRSVRRLTELVDSVLDVSRIATGRLTIEPAREDLSQIVAEFVERMHEAAAKAGCTISTTIEPNIVGTWDALRLGQVVTNILSNAFKYAAGSAVDVTLKAEGSTAILSVSDRGPGIDPEHLERIFARFHRAASARHYGGLGLGLYVANEIVAAHGGTLRATNRDGGGATIEMTLPIKGES